MSRLSRITKLVFLHAMLGLVLMCSASLTRADTLTFSTLEQAGSSLVHIADPYFESGYRIQDGGELYYAQQSNVLYAGSAGLHERISGGLLTLTRVDGGTFRLTSIDLSVLHPQGTSPAVVFVGTLVGGGTVTQTFTPTLFGFHTFSFSSAFTNLLSVSWHQGSDELNAHQFDNIVVSSAVPEPASVAVFGTGLVGLVAKLRRRRKQ
jgi:PEP-CTERM motif